MWRQISRVSDGTHSVGAESVNDDEHNVLDSIHRLHLPSLRK
jgi:hypothetical protein